MRITEGTVIETVWEKYTETKLTTDFATGGSDYSQQFTTVHVSLFLCITRLTLD